CPIDVPLHVGTGGSATPATLLALEAAAQRDPLRRNRGDCVCRAARTAQLEARTYGSQGSFARSYGAIHPGTHSVDGFRPSGAERADDLLLLQRRIPGPGDFGDDLASVSRIGARRA